MNDIDTEKSSVIPFISIVDSPFALSPWTLPVGLTDLKTRVP
ncbi:MAG: hypothetical protein NTX44_06630 [Ignavibacteriales bacterium]|nr:hypothetical protein [Ignavibacteriales bacterium]